MLRRLCIIPTHPIFNEFLAKGIPQSSFKHIKTLAGLDIGVPSFPKKLPLVF